MTFFVIGDKVEYKNILGKTVMGTIKDISETERIYVEWEDDVSNVFSWEFPGVVKLSGLDEDEIPL